MERLRSLVDERPCCGRVQKAYFERLSQRMKACWTASFDQDRVLQEAALHCRAQRRGRRSDAAAHPHRALHRLLEQDGEVGKKLDFLLQEMNREANTLLSKTSGVSGNGQRITDLGLGMKSEIEKAREQVQNLE